MEVEIRAGAKFDLVSPKELDDRLKNFDWSAGWRERARGEKHFFIPALSGTLTGTYPTSTSNVGGTTAVPVGPKEGYCWAIRRLQVAGLGASDQIVVYRNAQVDLNVICRLTGNGANSFVGFTNVQALLLGGDILLFGPGATQATTTVITVTGEAIEVPEEMLWKLV